MSLESRLSERQFFMLSLAGLSALILVLFFAVLRPRLQERAELREQVESKTRQLQTAGYLLGEGPLLQKKTGSGSSGATTVGRVGNGHRTSFQFRQSASLAIPGCDQHRLQNLPLPHPEPLARQSKATKDRAPTRTGPSRFD